MSSPCLQSWPFSISNLMWSLCVGFIRGSSILCLDWFLLLTFMGLDLVEPIVQLSHIGFSCFEKSRILIWRRICSARSVSPTCCNTLSRACVPLEVSIPPYFIIMQSSKPVSWLRDILYVTSDAFITGPEEEVRLMHDFISRVLAILAIDPAADHVFISFAESKETIAGLLNVSASLNYRGFALIRPISFTLSTFDTNILPILALWWLYY